MRLTDESALEGELRGSLSASLAAQQRVLDSVLPELLQLSRLLIETVDRGGTVFWIGNGGSGAQAQHAAAELMARFQETRSPVPSLSMSASPAVWTAIGNDFGFSAVFSRQVEALVKPDDILLGLTTSGRSRNVVNALEAAKRRGARTAALVGPDADLLHEHCDVLVRVQTPDPAHIQEAHLVLIHALCRSLEKGLRRDES